MDRKIVVTGAGGSIGSVVARTLHLRGEDVIGIDRRAPETRDFPWRYGDLGEREVVMRALEGADAVIHLGEIPNIYGPFPPDEVFAQNTRAGSTVFEAAGVQGVNHVVYASSAQMYGVWGHAAIPPLHLPFDETHPPRPRNAYGLSKYANEQYLRLVVNLHENIGAVALRFPGVMGVWRSWDWTLDHLRAHTEAHDGMGTYIHLDDLVEAILLSLDHTIAGEVQTYNVFADDLVNLTPTRDYLRVIWPDLELPEDWPEHKSWVLNDRIREALGWSPKRSAIREWRERQNPTQ